MLWHGWWWTKWNQNMNLSFPRCVFDINGMRWWSLTFDLSFFLVILLKMCVCVLVFASSSKEKKINGSKLERSKPNKIESNFNRTYKNQAFFFVRNQVNCSLSLNTNVVVFSKWSWSFTVDWFKWKIEKNVIKLPLNKQRQMFRH